VGDLIREEISEIIIRRLKDPRVGFITVTGVEMTDDLKSARVYISVLEKRHTAETLEVLNSASGFIKKEVARDVRLRSTPSLEFFEDKSIAYGEKIDGLLDMISKDSKNAARRNDAAGAAHAPGNAAPASAGAAPAPGSAAPGPEGEGT
jgi:ribosome-binding factor A